MRVTADPEPRAPAPAPLHTDFIRATDPFLSRSGESLPEHGNGDQERKGLVIGSQLEKAAAKQIDDVELEIDELRAELARQRAQLVLSEAAMHEVRQAVSQVFQAPLTTISGFAELLARRYEGRLDADADEFIEFIVKSARRFDEMLRDLCTYLEIGEKEPPAAPVDCSQIVQAAIDSLSVLMARTKATVIVEPIPNVRGDSTQIGQLFRQLISNALNCVNGAPPRVRITAKREDGGVCFSVTDNGLGIHPSHTDRVFDLFQRLHAPEAPAGIGAGLAICKKIVERHGGRIWVEHVPTGGSRFSFTIPNRAPASS
jgi:light-regulated signal transduction histidine kinase (bacteriophytochrome)